MNNGGGEQHLLDVPTRNFVKKDNIHIETLRSRIKL